MKKPGSLKGKTIVITGKLEHFTRNPAHDRIRELGGIPKNSISQNTDYLICATKAGSKLAKAQSLGIEAISEKEFLEILKTA